MQGLEQRGRRAALGSFSFQTIATQPQRCHLVTAHLIQTWERTEQTWWHLAKSNYCLSCSTSFNFYKFVSESFDSSLQASDLLRTSLPQMTGPQSLAQSSQELWPRMHSLEANGPLHPAESCRSGLQHQVDGLAGVHSHPNHQRAFDRLWDFGLLSMCTKKEMNSLPKKKRISQSLLALAGAVLRCLWLPSSLWPTPEVVPQWWHPQSTLWR